jgi:hypothetical protein
LKAVWINSKVLTLPTEMVLGGGHYFYISLENLRLQELDWIGSCSGVEANKFGQFAGADGSLNGDRLGRIPLLAQQGHSGGAGEGPICDGQVRGWGPRRTYLTHNGHENVEKLNVS